MLTRTPDKDLVLAAKTGQLDEVRRALEQAADVAATDRRGCTALYHACKFGHLAIATELLTRGAKLSGIPFWESSLFMYRLCQAPEEVLDIYAQAGVNLDKLDLDGVTLHDAIEHGDEETVRAFMEREPDPGEEPWHTWMSETGLLPLHLAALHGRLELAQLLLERGAPPDPLDADEQVTPLYLAAEYGHAEIARALVERGARTDWRYPSKEWTPLHAAVIFRHPGVVKVLLEAGADANACEAGGLTPRQIAEQSGQEEVIQHLASFPGA